MSVLASSSGCRDTGYQVTYEVRANVTNALVSRNTVRERLHFCWTGSGFSAWVPGERFAHRDAGVVSTVVYAQNDHDLWFSTYDKAMETQFKSTSLVCDHYVTIEIQADQTDGLVNSMYRVGFVWSSCAQEHVVVTNSGPV